MVVDVSSQQSASGGPRLRMQLAGVMRALRGLAAAALVAVVANGLQILPVLAGPACITVQLAAGASLNICLESPVGGVTLKGDQAVRASVAISGGESLVRRVVFYLDDAYLITDFEAPYGFTLPTAQFVDGTHVLSMEVHTRDATITQRVRASLVFSNGVKAPPASSGGFAPYVPRPKPGLPFTVAAVSDGAGGEATSTAVTDRILSWKPDLFIYMGDVYEKGTYTEFYNWYGSDHTFFGRLKAITNPAVGDHEYELDRAPGYFQYWRNPPNYYSYNAGGWHFVSLNSTGQFHQTQPGSPQYEWLRADLAANATSCTLVYFQHPALSVGPQGGVARMDPIWALLANAGVDLVIAGNDHDYQRWLPVNGSFASDPSGPMQFVVGTGGHAIKQFVRKDPRLAFGIDKAQRAYGALRLQLDPHGASYQFVETGGEVADSGARVCSGSPPDRQPPQKPNGLLSTAVSARSVVFRWQASTDDILVTGYRVYRNGTLIAELDPSAPSYSDDTVVSGRTYQYEVSAVDASGKDSGRSTKLDVVVPAIGGLATTGSASTAGIQPVVANPAAPDQEPLLARIAPLGVVLLVAGFIVSLLLLGTRRNRGG